MSARTYHLPHKRAGELSPLRALRREARPRQRGEVVRPGVVALGARPLRGQTGLAVSPRPGEPYLDSIRLQRAEGRELDGAVDDMGRTRRERRAWASVLRGFVVAIMASCALQAVAAEPATPVAAVAWDDALVRPVVYLLEPAKDVAQNPLGITAGSQRNALLGCWHSTTDNQGHVVAHGWTMPTSPAGGGKIRLPEYDRLTIGQGPYRVQAGCAGACGAGCFSPPYSGTLEWQVTVP